MKDKEYIEKWLDGTLSESERQAFEKTGDYKELEKLDRELKKFKAPDYVTEEEYANILQKLQKETKVVPLKWLRPFLKVAAVFLVIVVGYGLYNTIITENIQTEMASQSELFLPDSSKVILNAQSDISYGAYNWQSNRSVQLKGEVFFEVAKGSTFDVKSALGIVRVLGTKFNVISRDEYLEVVCFEGKVQIEFGARTESITPGVMFRALNGNITIKNVSLADEPSWMVNESSFSSLPYAYVIDELERQYNTVIQTKSVDTSLLFTGSFVHDDLELALKAITGPLNLQYTIQDKEIILTGEN
jgi:ferric-dicitrate binding protein FerR (iron transport regulator)